MADESFLKTLQTRLGNYRLIALVVILGGTIVWIDKVTQSSTAIASLVRQLIGDPPLPPDDWKPDIVLRSRIVDVDDTRCRYILFSTPDTGVVRIGAYRLPGFNPKTGLPATPGDVDFSRDNGGLLPIDKPIVIIMKDMKPGSYEYDFGQPSMTKEINVPDERFLLVSKWTYADDVNYMLVPIELPVFVKQVSELEIPLPTCKMLQSGADFAWRPIKVTQPGG